MDESVVKAAVLIESAIKYRCILHGLDNRRIAVYRVYYSKSFLFISNICLVILFILPFFEWPSSLTKSSDLRTLLERPVVPCGLLEGIEFVCLLIFLSRAVLLAFLFWKQEFLRNKWLIGQFVVLVISFADLIAPISTGCSEFYRIRRFFRPYFLISGSQMLKKTIKCLWNTLPELASFLLLLMLWILSATVVAMCLFSGPLRHKNYSMLSSHFYQVDRVGLSWLYDTFYNLVVLLTTANHPDVILTNYNDNRASAFFDIAFIAVGSYIFMNIFTAIMYKQFRGYLFSSVNKRIFRRRVAVRAAFEVLKSPDHIPVVAASKVLQLLEKTSLPGWKKSTISTKLMTEYEGRSVKVNEFMNAFRLLDSFAPLRSPTPVRQFQNPLALQIQSFCLSDLCRRIKLFVSFVNVFCIILQLVAFEDVGNPNFTFLTINAVFSAVYVIEVGVDLWIRGWRNSLFTPLILFDVIVCTGNLALRFFEIGLVACGISHVGADGWLPYDFGQLANLLVISRTFRFMQISNLMTDVLLQMPHHLAPVLGILISFYYVYALLGLTLFHSVIELPSNKSFVSNETYTCGTYQQLNYWSINFDDFAASIFTLWSLMVLNNWHVIVRAFTDKLGRWVHVYMLTWLLVAAVVLALITAMIVESFLFAHQLHTRRVHVSPAHKCCPINSHRSAIVDVSRHHDDDRRHLINDGVVEELLPGFELSPDDVDSSQAATAEAANSSVISSTAESLASCFAQIMGGNFDEPTNEELLSHLRRHVELNGLILP